MPMVGSLAKRSDLRHGFRGDI